MPARGTGPIPAIVMIVGEAWGEYEESAGEPFVGPSGQELNRMLAEVGINRLECFVTNLVNQRPPQNDLGAWIAFKKKDITAAHVPLKDKWVLPIVRDGFNQLQTEIAAIQPNLIIAFGNAAMWALTGLWGITKWRGSQLSTDNGINVVPTYHPAAILRQWEWRAAAINDLRRAKRFITARGYPNKPAWKFIVSPTFEQAQEVLTYLFLQLESGVPLWIDLDLETRSGHIACIGLSWSRTEAICIPLMCQASKEGYWLEEQELWIVWQIYQITTHRLVKIRGQNLLYDCQYTYRHWHFIPRVAQDTMISQHSVFSDQPKALAYIASTYCDYFVYWKDEGKNFIEGGRDENAGWIYNCEDCVYTRESGEVLEKVAKSMGLEAVHAAQQRMFWPVLQAMLKGVRVSLTAREQIAGEIQEQISLRENFLREVLGHPININSSKQMIELFYTDLGQPPIKSRPKKGQPSHVTCDDEALTKIGKREPLLAPIVTAIADLRTLGKFHDEFVMMPLDSDGRMRCSFNIGGSESGKSAPKTFRLSSSKSAFDSGGNLMTIPSEKSKSVGKAAARAKENALSILGDPYQFPNLRAMYVPDPGFTWFDGDLSRADLYAMAWDADEPILKEVLRKNVDIHLFNVYVMDKQEPPPLDELVEGHPKYLDHREPRKHKREFMKVFAHATDYLGKSRTVAAATGRTVHEVERGQKIYLGTYQGIEKWQKRVVADVQKYRFVENAFGYRWYVFDKIDDQLFPEAVAWIPQSTVSIVINRIWENIYLNAPEVQVLLQVHDSLPGQFPTHRKESCLAQIAEAAKVIVPYSDPLIIPFSVTTSTESWGACK